MNPTWRDMSGELEGQHRHPRQIASLPSAASGQAPRLARNDGGGNVPLLYPQLLLHLSHRRHVLQQ